ncbi:hypothetical protein HJFPF1_03839 [Paramyrothecium foliicola]|nr:hypothetical protein HJFPF1_03839 [Paramyrothecium foliicola]
MRGKNWKHCFGRPAQGGHGEAVTPEKRSHSANVPGIQPHYHVIIHVNIPPILLHFYDGAVYTTWKTRLISWCGAWMRPIKCDENTKLSCPTDCPAEQCRFTIPSGDCPKECAKSFCDRSAPLDQSTDSETVGGSGGPSAGAIAGGVIGGIIVIAIATYLVWRFLIKPKRSQMPPSVFEVNATPSGDLEKDTASRMTKRSSTHTVHSIASTVLTRASNIIQIAYIPGVTNRATPSSPTVLVPPVPPIPMHHADGSKEFEQDDQHFFVPGDLRDSTYSGLSGYSQRTSYARTSYAPRSSVASTIYGKQAHVVNPAQTFIRAKPTVVSVKSMGNSSASSTAGSTPPVPNIDYDKFSRPKSRDSTFSVGSTFLNNANTAMPVRAQVVKVGTSLKKGGEHGSKSDVSVVSSAASPVPPPSPETSTAYSVRDSNISSTLIEDSPAIDQGPFSDPPERPHLGGANSSNLGAVMEEDAEHARMGDRNSRRLGSTERGSSPFSDDHATRD